MARRVSIAERVIHRVGAYRLRVLSSEIITVGGAGDRNDPGTLQQMETLSIRVSQSIECA